MSDMIRQRFDLGSQWPTVDPFLFVAHHNDAYPVGNERLGPKAELDGRALGQDFSRADGWSMYHGVVVPGFPQHPHRGFETITYVRRGLIDHSDSLGATARFGRGDTQWMTAGAGIQHAEMFPLVDRDNANPLELFQIWLNLPASDKFVDPYFTMFWDADTPRRVLTDDSGRTVEVTVIAGRLDDADPPKPPPNSWAARPEADVAIWHIRMEAGTHWVLPEIADQDVQRTLYAFDGSRVVVGDGEELRAGSGALLSPSEAVPLTADPAEGVELMLLQGRPIGEPVAQYGPFVMNDESQIREAMAEYQRTQFGGWPWSNPAPDHGRESGRFAVHADGRREEQG